MTITTTISRPIKIHLCRDGTISYRRDREPILNGVALPVFSVDTEEQAKAIQVRFGRRQYTEHPDQPGRSWYKLFVLEDGTDPASRPDHCLIIDDLDGVTRMFEEFFHSLEKLERLK